MENNYEEIADGYRDARNTIVDNILGTCGVLTNDEMLKHNLGKAFDYVLDTLEESISWKWLCELWSICVRGTGIPIVCPHKRDPDVCMETWLQSDTVKSQRGSVANIANAYILFLKTDVFGISSRMLGSYVMMRIGILSNVGIPLITYNVLAQIDDVLDNNFSSIDIESIHNQLYYNLSRNSATMS